MINLNIEKLNSEFISGLNILAPIYGIGFSKNGIVIEEEPCEKGYSVISDGKVCKIRYSKKVFFFTAFSFLLQYENKPFFIERNAIENLGIMRDSARNAVLSVDGLKELAVYSALMGYTYIEIYAEDLFELPNYPYLGQNRGRYTKDEITAMDKFCANFGIELIPCMQALAHLPHIFRHDAFENIHDLADILLIGDNKTYEFLDSLISFISQSFTSRKINIGMDEAHLFGQGKYCELFGENKDRANLFLTHLNKVVDICVKHGLKPSMWSDMIFKVAFDIHDFQSYLGLDGKIVDDKIKKALPKELQLIFWDYYHTEKKFYDQVFSCHYQLTDRVAFAGGAWTWFGFAPLNSYAEKRLEPAIKSAIENGCKDFLLTAWGDGGGECFCMNAVSTYLFVAERFSGESSIESLNERAKAIFGNTYEELKSIEILDDTTEDIISTDRENNAVNPSKYLLYNDPLIGVMNAHIKDDISSVYAKNTKKLEMVLNGGGKLKRYFESAYYLCKLLEIKSTLGLEIKRAYENNDKNALLQVVENSIPTCIKRLQEFFDCYRSVYLTCNKSFGVEIVDIRLGGLKQRLNQTQVILKDYIDGKIDKIDQLEIKTITPRSFDKLGEPVLYNSFLQSLTGFPL